jgi:hypothetical protein
MAAPTGLPAFRLSSRPSSSPLASEEVGELQEHQRAVLRRRLLVRLEGRRGGVDRPVDVLCSALRDVGDDLVVGRVHDLLGLARGGVDERPAD